jgi:Ca2+-binding RTX toxin-like protein
MGFAIAEQGCLYIRTRWQAVWKAVITAGKTSGTGLSPPAGNGVYTLAATDPATLTSELDSLTFHPSGLPSGGTSVTTNFTLAVSDPAFPTPATDRTTTVTEKACFLVFDQTTGQTSVDAGTSYTGPVAGLSTQFIDLSPDNLDIAAIAPNSFIYSGSGSDGINISQAGGNNTIDATGGSNFLVGGSGNDTFFLNDLDPTAPIWSTLVNFHAGDNATIWGVTPDDFSISWAAGQGAPTYSGLTMHVTAAGKPAAYLTLAGMTPADLSNGHLAVQFGTVNGTNYM